MRDPRPRVNRNLPTGRVAAVIAVATAILVAAPVISIIALAINPAPDVWRDLVAYVLPRAMIDTALLLGGVGALALSIGAGTAWLISLHDFRGRAMLVWLMPLPLAIPTYLAAYVYADLFEPLGLVHRTLALWFPLRDVVTALPNLRSMPGAIIVIGLVLYPYVYLSARTMFQFQSAEFGEAARTLGAGRWTVFWRVSLPMARPALAVGVALVSLETLNDIGASEYLGVRTLTVSIFTTWLNLGSLAGAAQLSCFMLAIVAGLIAIERYGRRNTTAEFSAESPRLTPRTRLSGIRGRAAFAACLLPVLLGFVVPVLYLLQQSFRPRAAGEFRHGAGARRLQFDCVRNPRHAGRARARLRDHPGLALAAEPGALHRDEHLADRLRAARPGAGARPADAGAGDRQRAERDGRMDRTLVAGTDPGRLGRRRGHRLCDPVPGGADRDDQGRVRADSARL